MLIVAKRGEKLFELPCVAGRWMEGLMGLCTYIVISGAWEDLGRKGGVWWRVGEFA